MGVIPLSKPIHQPKLSLLLLTENRDILGPFSYTAETDVVCPIPLEVTWRTSLSQEPLTAHFVWQPPGPVSLLTTKA